MCLPDFEILTFPIPIFVSIHHLSTYQFRTENTQFCLNLVLYHDLLKIHPIYVDWAPSSVTKSPPIAIPKFAKKHPKRQPHRAYINSISITLSHYLFQVFFYDDPHSAQCTSFLTSIQVYNVIQLENRTWKDTDFIVTVWPTWPIWTSIWMALQHTKYYVKGNFLWHDFLSFDLLSRPLACALMKSLVI